MVIVRQHEVSKMAPMVALFADSRINTVMEAEIRRLDISGYNINVYSMPGARIDSVCVAVHNYVSVNPGDIVYISAGINDTNTPHRPTFKGGRTTYTFDWESEDDFVFSMCDKFTYVHKHLMDYHGDQRIILCPLIGMQLNRTCTNATPARQDMMDKGVWRINSCINFLNRLAKTSTPWISRVIHTHRNTVGRRHEYAKYLRDGLHFGDTVIPMIALILSTHIAKTRDKIVQHGYKPI